MLVRRVVVMHARAALGRRQVRAEQEERGEKDKRDDDGDHAPEAGDAGNFGWEEGFSGPRGSEMSVVGVEGYLFWLQQLCYRVEGAKSENS